MATGENGTTFWLPPDVAALVDKIRHDRRDTSRSDTVRFLILRAAAELRYLPVEQRKALGFDTAGVRVFPDRGNEKFRS